MEEDARVAVEKDPANSKASSRSGLVEADWLGPAAVEPEQGELLEPVGTVPFVDPFRLKKAMFYYYRSHFIAPAS